jgi:tRNA A37 threonylcarbamoyladenosine biosynthesis protein TsaE
MFVKKYTTNSEKETFTLAKNLARNLKGGEVIALIGNLGAGKTVFVKGLAAGLGVKEVVNSPTFVLMKLYKIQKLRMKNQEPSTKNQISSKSQIPPCLSAGRNPKEIQNPKSKIRNTNHESRSSIFPGPLPRASASGAGDLRSSNDRLQTTDYTLQTLVHVDAYRIKDPQELIDIGINDYLGQKNTVTVIEWADQVRSILTKDAKYIKIEGITTNKRNIIMGYG